MAKKSQIEEVAEICKKDQEEKNKQYLIDSNKRLFKIISTKLRTSFIGSLSAFEESFGHLWGHLLQESELTDNQKKWKRLWENTRTMVLNNGNHQIRSVENELSQYDISWNRHSTVLKPKED